jgi:hypothetical protein
MNKRMTTFCTLTDTITIKELVDVMVPRTTYELVDVPGSTTDWSFMHKQRVAYTYDVCMPQWVVVEHRLATQVEIDQYYTELYDALVF